MNSLWQVELTDFSLLNLAHQQKTQYQKDSMKLDHSFQTAKGANWQPVYQYYDVLCHVAGLRQDRVRSTVLGVGWDPLLFLKDQAKGGVTLITSRGVKPISAGLLIDRELGTQTSQPWLPLAGDKTGIRVRYLSQLERMSREELGRKEDLLPKAIAPPEMDPPLLPSQEHQLCPASTTAWAFHRHINMLTSLGP